MVQIVSLLGPRFGPQPDGSMGYYDNMSPERVEGGGVCGCWEAGWIWVAGLLQAASPNPLPLLICLGVPAVWMHCLIHYTTGQSAMTVVQEPESCDTAPN